MPEVWNLETERYIVLETYKKDGSAVRTPVWFVLQDDLVFVVTRENTGKVKRLNYNQNVRIAACKIRGDVTGEWHQGIATKLSTIKSEPILKLRDKKYGFMAKIAKFASRGKGDFIVYSIQL